MESIDLDPVHVSVTEGVGSACPAIHGGPREVRRFVAANRGSAPKFDDDVTCTLERTGGISAESVGPGTGLASPNIVKEVAWGAVNWRTIRGSSSLLAPRSRLGFANGASKENATVLSEALKAPISSAGSFDAGMKLIPGTPTEVKPAPSGNPGTAGSRAGSTRMSLMRSHELAPFGALTWFVPPSMSRSTEPRWVDTSIRVTTGRC
jgi:hypothetical protein